MVSVSFLRERVTRGNTFRPTVGRLLPWHFSSIDPDSNDWNFRRVYRRQPPRKPNIGGSDRCLVGIFAIPALRTSEVAALQPFTNYSKNGPHPF